MQILLFPNYDGLSPIELGAPNPRDNNLNVAHTEDEEDRLRTESNNRIHRLHELGEQAGCPYPRELVFERNGTISCR